jgi:hypothetical protein
LMAMKLGYTPIINSSFADITSFRIFCPSNWFYIDLPIVPVEFF